tara:strand:- start:17889 stop:18572 length:684 start_codon:yes stop_codon:yes gene_type:complete
MTTRVLTPLDKDDIYDLMMRRYIQLSKNPIQARTNDNVTEQYNIFLDEHMDFKWENGLPNAVNKGRAFGYFKDNELMVILTQRFSTSRMPSWYVGNMITCPSLKGYREAAKITSKLLDLAVEDAEKYGYTQFFWVTSTKGWNRREQFWYNYSNTFKRYNVFIENVVPAGQEPKFDYEKVIMGYRTHPTDLAIKSAKIKPHIQHEKFKEYLKVEYKPLQEKDNEFGKS